MALATYSDLVTSIGNWIHRTDLSTQIDDFIDMAESAMNRELRLSEMENRATTTISTEYIALPSDYLEMRDIRINDTYSYPLEFRSPHQMDLIDVNESSRPRYYSIVDETIQVYPFVSGYVMEIDYYKKITALDSTNTTNVVLTAWPDLYFNGCLYFANVYVKNMDMAAYHKQEFDRLLIVINNKSKNRKFSGAPLQVRPA